jgi:dipeptidyl aminopeptidase/acylaminoacyl peptidase
MIMRRDYSFVTILMSVALLVQSTSWASTGDPNGRHPMTHEDLIKMRRVGNPAPSPDGQWIVFSLGDVDYEDDKSETNLWIMRADGSDQRPLTTAKGTESSPAWSPDSSNVAFVARRDGENEIYLLDLNHGGEARQLTKLPTGAGGPKWSPDGKFILFNSAVFPDCGDMDCNEKKAKEWKERKVKAQTFDELPFRTWDTWRSPRRNHLFIIPAQGGEARDLLAGADLESPPWPQGGPDEYSWNPDGQEIAFVAAVKEQRDQRQYVPTDIFTVSINGGSPKDLTNTPALSEGAPAYSPDGRWLAYMVAYSTVAYKNRHLVRRDRQNGQVTDLIEAWDRSAGNFVWSPDSKTIYLEAEEDGVVKVWALSVQGGVPKELAGEATYGGVAMPGTGMVLYATKQRSTMPAEICSLSTTGGTSKQLTDFNRTRRERIDWQEIEPFWYDGADGARSHGWLIKPPSFDPNKKYPLILLVHGGPYGAWEDSFHYRWNLQLFAAPGYVVIALNPRGSTGFGERYAAEIGGDWGGKVYRDLMLGVDYCLKTYPFIDGQRMAAAGASYGGYMMNWMLGHTDRFKAIVSHAGVYDAVSMYGATEIPWFMEENFGGAPWRSTEDYKKFSPHLSAANFKTPTLVSHGELDYRVPVAQGFELFTTLQRLNVPSRLLYFPDENHWVLKPANSKRWYEEVNAWFARWLK